MGDKVLFDENPLPADFGTGDFSRFSLFSERLPVYFQVVSRLFEVEGFHRLIDVSKLCRAGPFEASRNAFSDENLNKFCPLIERDNGAGFAG